MQIFNQFKYTVSNYFVGYSIIAPDITGIFFGNKL